MDHLAGCVFAIFISVFVIGLSAHYLNYNKTAGAGGWYAMWWWTGALGVLGLMTAIITAGTLLKHMYF